MRTFSAIAVEATKKVCREVDPIRIELIIRRAMQESQENARLEDKGIKANPLEIFQALDRRLCQQVGLQAKGK